MARQNFVISNISHWTHLPNHDLATSIQIRSDENGEGQKFDQTNSQHGKDNQVIITTISTNEKISQRKVNSHGTPSKIAMTTTNDKSSQWQVRSHPPRKKWTLDMDTTHTCILSHSHRKHHGKRITKPQI
jgi:hypothetical protein